MFRNMLLSNFINGFSDRRNTCITQFLNFGRFTYALTVAMSCGGAGELLWVKA